MRDDMQEVGTNKNRVVIFTTDSSYLLPTLVAAEQVYLCPGVKEIADVIIFLVGLSPDEEAKISREFDPRIFKFISMKKGLFNLPEGVTFADSHVPITALARLYTPPLIPLQYAHIVYLDGDTQITGDLLPFIELNVPQGRILAATEKYYMNKSNVGYTGLLWKNALKYLSELGISNPEDYFSSGVLAARRDAWTDICSDALKFFYENSRLCLYHDQSALNAVSLGRREVLHPAYNYMTAYAEVKGHGIRPAVVHFTGSDKPWLFFDRSPWLNKFSKVYKGFFKGASHFKYLRGSLGPLSVSNWVPLRRVKTV